MILTVDTSVIIAVITNEKHKRELIRLTKGYDLIAPESLHWEIGNAFSAMFKRNKISLDAAKKAIEYYLQIPLRLVETDLIRALEISEHNKIYAYDAYFLACSIKYGTNLITLDDKMRTIANQYNIKTLEV